MAGTIGAMPAKEIPGDGREQSFSEFVVDRVTAEMAATGMSIREMARLSGISAARLHRRLHGNGPFNTDELEAVANVLGVEPSALTCRA
ncbi:MAG: helix-turn-helix domain-containing protein [Mycetocola sp.]